MLNRTVAQNETAAKTLWTYLVPREAVRLERQAKQYADAGEVAHQIFLVMEYLCMLCGLKITEPHWVAGGNDDTIMQWCVQLFDQMHSDKIGRITYEGEHATYSWYEVKTSAGILNNSLSRLKWTHTILHPKARKLPVNFPVPAKAQLMLDRIESIDVLRRSCRVVQGMLVGKTDEVSANWTERTAAGRALDSTKSFAVKHGKTIGMGVAGMAATAGIVALAMAKAAAPMVAVAAADPAIVVGDIVFFGWEN